MTNSEHLDNIALYEQEDHWNRGYDKWFYQKKSLLQSLVESDVDTILDVGCGDGGITNDFCPGKKVVGCDRSEAALTHVTTDTVRASCDELPFEDNSFDFVMCSEVLEHLPVDVFHRAIKELGRVSKKYIVISVPYRETLTVNVTRCASCGTKYNMDGHIRRFANAEEIAACFDGFKLDFSEQCGDSDPRPRSFLVKLRRALLRDWPVNELAICPKCGGKTVARKEHPNRLLTWLFDRLEWRTASRPMPRWIVIRLIREKS